MSQATKTIYLKNSKISLTSKDYKVSGGEGEIYVKNGIVFKIFHEVQKMIPEQKITELQSLLPLNNVLVPKEIIRDQRGTSIGFTTSFISNAEPLCKFFTKNYRNQIGFSEQDTIDVVKKIQETISDIHSKDILIVDVNELNFLLKNKTFIPYFIDVNSYQTKNFPATAIMMSIADPKVTKTKSFTDMSDWFSFAIISFQLYIGIHPFRGRHPKYGKKEEDLKERMEKCISVFEKEVITPPSCRPLSVIPKSQLDWYKRIFKDGERSAPPIPGALPPVSGADLVLVIHGNEKFAVDEIIELKEDALRAFSFPGEMFFITKNSLYLRSRGNAIVKDISQYDKVGICESPGNKPLICMKKDGNIYIEEILGEKVEVIKSDDFMIRDKYLYTVGSDNIIRWNFIEGKKILASSKFVAGCHEKSTKVFDGVIYQDMFGKPAFFIPYGDKSAYFDIIKEMSGYRILDAKSEDNLLVVLAEKKGKYSRFVIIFDEKFSSYSIREVEDVQYHDINFTKMPSKPCVLCIDDNIIEIFFDNKKVKEIDNSPFDHTMKLFNDGNKVFFMNGKKIFSVSMK